MHGALADGADGGTGGGVRVLGVGVGGVAAEEEGGADHQGDSDQGQDQVDHGEEADGLPSKKTVACHRSSILASTNSYLANILEKTAEMAGVVAVIMTASAIGMCLMA